MSHTYVPTNWVNKKTQLNADNMNKIEEELARLARESGGITEIREGLGITVSPTSDESSVIVGLKNGSSEDNLLLLDKDNGLILTLNMGYDPELRRLTISSGSGWSQSVDFDIDKAVVNGSYDPETMNIVLTLSDDSEVLIDMSKFKLNWKFIESSTISVTESTDELGVQSFKLECKVSSNCKNNIEIRDDGLFSERLDWGGIGISDETDGLWEFEDKLGSKYWVFESSSTVKIDKTTVSSECGESIDYYNFGYVISEDEDNQILIKNNKLYVPDEIPEEKELRLELQRIREEYEVLLKVKMKSSSTISSTDTLTQFNERYIESNVVLSRYSGNELVINDDGIMLPPYTPGPGKPDLSPYVEKLENLEDEYPRKSIEIEYIKTSLNI